MSANGAGAMAVNSILYRSVVAKGANGGTLAMYQYLNGLLECKPFQGLTREEATAARAARKMFEAGDETSAARILEVAGMEVMLQEASELTVNVTDEVMATIREIPRGQKSVAINEAAASLDPAEYNRLIANGIGTASMRVTPTPAALVNAARLFVPIRRLLVAGAGKVAI